MDLEGKKVLVYGAGKSGIGAVRLLAARGAVPVLYDEKKSPEEVEASLPEDIETGIVTGPCRADAFSDMDLVVLSPGVPTDAPLVLDLKDAGIPIWGEVELAYEAAGRGQVLAITGTNGKTTTTSLVGAIMKSVAPEVYVVGNIGNAYTGAALTATDESVVVAEISSFQLETIHNFRPLVSAILNITPDHLNRHHTMEEYIRVKERIAENQDKNCICVLNYEDPVLRAFGDVCPARVVWFSSERALENGFFLRDREIVYAEEGREAVLLDVDELSLIGVHNYENVMAAAAVTWSAGVSLEKIAEVCREFKPVAHRIEFIARKRGVVWYNDSKGTNPDAAIRGIRAMSGPTFLIAGGYDKGSDYSEWIRSFDGKVKKLVLEGATAEAIRSCALTCGFPEEDIVMRKTMREAMDYCRDTAEEGDAVLLSPACASWGEFPNYEVRGDTFRDYVTKEIPEEA